MNRVIRYFFQGLVVVVPIAVTAYVFAARNGATVGNLDRLVKADGTELKR